MKEPHIAARAASIAHAKEDQRQGELDELVGALKRLMIDTMARRNDFAALRAIDMIARLRGLTPTTAKRSDGLDAALEEMRQQNAENEDKDKAEDEKASPPPAPETVFDPPMPPELPPPVEPAPAPEPEPEPPSPARTREAATEAARAEVRRRLFRYEHLMAQHPELSSEIRDLSDTQAYFDASDNLLPPELWPDHAGPTDPES
jgi:outer membrane biosynthesis protein TonB